MPEPGYLLAAVAVSAAITWGLRALPFALLGPLRRSPLVAHLGAGMPVGVMAVLVAHTLRDVPLAVPPHGLPTALALATTVGLHLWRRDIVLSIVAGTAVHVVLLSAILR
ncbi:branched-chain amino acid transporter permease [Pseudonocardia humida]|uniref:AzlD domain-containing protein n=1 Tax=Pseudonocardia humida TaxID=2800819 RepID=A0ABT1A4P6_9PSEU|nr:AzlD domain-containing protein [Pseudonocardia humida]MCO1657968.1 AzlD domain-containing protein [Pseudonocardia humida]